jgi:hypothetical protein
MLKDEILPKRFANSDHYFNTKRLPIAPQKRDFKKKAEFTDQHERLYMRATGKFAADQWKEFTMIHYDEKQHTFFWVAFKDTMPEVHDVLEVSKEKKKYTVVDVSPMGYAPYRRSRKTGWVILKGHICIILPFLISSCRLRLILREFDFFFVLFLLLLLHLMLLVDPQFCRIG